jgi:Ca-activated chloride channel family protein
VVEAAAPAAPADLVELTLTVTRQEQPLLGVTPGQLRVRVDGREVADAELAGAGQAPLALALAVDLSASMAPYLSELQRQLGPLALRVRGAGGRVCLLTVDAEARLAADWEAPPERLAEGLAAPGQAAAGDLAGLVSGALSALDRVRGRKVLLVVSDGGDTARGEDWSRASAAAAKAGVPLLVVALPGLDGRAERTLDRLATESGGESYQATTSDMLAAVLGHYGELLDGAYALRFRRPLPARGEPLRLEVEPLVEGVEVGCPQRVR